MRLTANELAREAAATGFQTEPLEKVILLLELLEAIRSHPFLKERVALKGGTALNLFRFDVPRLSVDIDLNYVGAVNREGMLANRPKIEQALHAVCGRVSVQPRRVPSDHAGGKWRLNFNRVAGGTSTLEMDVNFLLRTPLWPIERIDSRAVGTFQATDIPILDIHELAAGKLAALLSRTASRDWSSTQASCCAVVASMPRSSGSRLSCTVAPAARTGERCTVDDVTVDAAEADAMLLPLLRSDNPAGGTWRPGRGHSRPTATNYCRWCCRSRITSGSSSSG